MSDITEYLENPTISKITRQEKNKYQMSHINVMDLMRRMEELEKKIIMLEDEIVNIKSNNTNLNQLSKSDIYKGDIIKFGRYEGNAIEWQVLDLNKEDNSALLISRYVLIEKAYNDNYISCTWEISTIREFLNNEFYNNTFNGEEKKKIQEKLLKNLDNKRSGVNGGKDTKDKIFLLSIDEIGIYLKTDEKRKAIFTDGKPKSYWLRSPGLVTRYAIFVNDIGYINEDGNTIDKCTIGVRPALWVNL